MNILTFLSTVMDFDEEGLASESLCESSLYATSPIIDEQLVVVHNDERSLTTHIRLLFTVPVQVWTISTPPTRDVLPPSFSPGPMSF